MLLVIDAYNVLKSVTPSVIVDEQERASFIHQLGRYAKKKQHKIVLVFDGGLDSRATQERLSGIYVVYAGFEQTADDYIKEYLKKHRERDILLVSSDRELRHTASQLNIESVPAHEFYAMMQDALRLVAEKMVRETPATKTAEGEDTELDTVMREGSKIVHHKVDDVVSKRDSRTSKARKLSKKERKKMKKIKKL